MSKRLTLTGVVFCLVVSLSLSSGVAAADGASDDDKKVAEVGAGTPDEFGTDAYLQSVGADLLRKQDALAAFKGWILDQPETADSGYIDQINDAGNLAVRLLWYSNDPFQAKVLAEAGRRGIAASVESRSMSRKQLSAAAQRILDSADVFGKRGFLVKSVATIGVADDGIKVEGVFVGDLALAGRESVPSSVREARKALARDVAHVGQADVKLVESDVEPALTRSTDISPFWAGGYMRKSDGAVCSSGFALRRSSVNYTTTARHCRGTFYARDNSSTSYGSNYLYSSDGGGSLLNSRGAGRMFDGAWNNASGYNKPVAGLRDVSLNDSVCTSGGNSGVHCNIKIDNMGVMWNDGYGSFSNIRGVQQTAGQIAAIQGDSGGPVLVPYTDGSVGAVGMIQAVAGTLMTGASCGSVHDAGGNQCSKTVLFSSTRTIANALGATLVTG